MAIKLFANYEHGKVGIMDTPRGLATLRVPFSLPARRGGPCKAVGNQGVARTGPLFRLCPMPYKSKLLTALGINGISIALRC